MTQQPHGAFPTFRPLQGALLKPRPPGVDHYWSEPDNRGQLEFENVTPKQLPFALCSIRIAIRRSKHPTVAAGNDGASATNLWDFSERRQGPGPLRVLP